MGDADAKPFYVLTLQGQLGPFDKQGLKDLVLAGGARPEDQVRTAFGRPLGTVREVVGHIRQTGSGRIATESPPSSSGRRPAATGSAAGRSPATASAAGRAHVRPHASGRTAATTSGRAARGSARGTAPAGRGRLWIVLLVAGLLAVAAVAAALLGRR